MENDELKSNLQNFFDIKNNLNFQNNYDYNNHINNLQNNFNEINLINFIPQNEIENEYETNQFFYLNNIKFLTSKFEGEFNENFINLVDYEFNKNKNDKNHYENTEKSDFKLNFNYEFKQIEISIKTYANFFKQNIFDNMFDHSIYKNDIENLKENINNNIKNKKIMFQIFIKNNSINQILYSNNYFILDLQHPPLFKTNFLLISGKNEYENTIFPFRNFEDEIDNLKFKRFFLLINKKFDNNFDYNLINENEENNKNFEFNSFMYHLKKIVKKEKIIHREKIEIIKNTLELISSKNFKYLTLSSYFNINKHYDLKEIYLKLKLYDENNKIPELNIIKFNYLILAIVSEGILTYFNAIEFVDNLLFNKKNYKQIIFDICSENEFPLFLIESLNKLIDTFQNRGIEFILSDFEKELKKIFILVYNNYINFGIDYITRASKNPNLLRIQRIIITPTFTLFTPYILDQGNRILRNYLSSTYLSMICGFKMDDFSETKWNNKILIEFIKFRLEKGINLVNKSYKFFNYSQSQFRNSSCWLLTDPESILPLTGDYSNINIVAKFGARVSQTLTTTRNTIIILKENIIKIPDIIKTDEKGNKLYIFSDGVGKISYILAKKISDKIHLNHVPSCFQGRFLGCKGVWTTMFDDFTGNIYIRPSQTKFKVKIENENYFELCDYSRYIQAYLNRQVILLMSARGIKNEIFFNKLNEYINSLEDEKFVLNLIHYEEWNKTFREMNNSGINMNNDRLIKSLVDNNKNLLYKDLKNRARIYVKDSAYVIGIMDEYGILNYGEAFCHIKRKNFDLILDKYCTVAKCPCLHPGDIRSLRFRKYNENDPSTEKYKIFENYENVLIFPQKGERPHPNELSGSDLDGDNYFIFYDNDLVKINYSPPMNYNLETKPLINNNIKIKDILKYYAEYTNLNSLGIIGDAHLAMADKDPLGANGEIPKRIAEKFSHAVDAPKTGEEIILDEEEQPKEFPHYMENKKNVYESRTILGLLYDKIKEYCDKIKNKNVENRRFIDCDLIVEGYQNFCFLAFVFYIEYFNEIINILRKNEVKFESVLLTGNNTDNEESVFSKKKHNYDLREKVSNEMKEIFHKYNKNFQNGLEFIFNKKELLFLNNEICYKNNLNLFASACYMISYDLKEIIEKGKTNLLEFKEKFKEIIIKSLRKEDDFNNFNMSNVYEKNNFGFEECFELFENDFDEYYDNYFNLENEINLIIENQFKSIEIFIDRIKRYFKLPERADEENQNRILSFPWVIAGKMLSSLKVVK